MAHIITKLQYLQKSLWIAAVLACLLLAVRVDWKSALLLLCSWAPVYYGVAYLFFEYILHPRMADAERTSLAREYMRTRLEETRRLDAEEARFEARVRKSLEEKEEAKRQQAAEAAHKKREEEAAMALRMKSAWMKRNSLWMVARDLYQQRLNAGLPEAHETYKWLCAEKASINAEKDRFMVILQDIAKSCDVYVPPIYDAEKARQLRLRGEKARAEQREKDRRQAEREELERKFASNANKIRELDRKEQIAREWLKHKTAYREGLKNGTIVMVDNSTQTGPLDEDLEPIF